MGTNYYWYEQQPCEKCNRHFDKKHIGKDSLGWCFSLHVYLEEGIHDLDDWIKIWNAHPEGFVENEYGEQIKFDVMYKLISEKLSNIKKSEVPIGYASWCDFNEKNYSVLDNSIGLLRHKVDGRFCIGHGGGTWDLIIGYFS